MLEIERSLHHLSLPDGDPALAEMRGAWVTVDLRAIAHNVARLRAWLPPHTRLMAVVKADGYGHGALAVAQTALLAGADWLGVATVTEGLKLRQLGLTQPMLLLGVLVPEAYPAAIEADLQITVSSAAGLMHLSQAATRQDKVAKVHLKVDTGMTRVGEGPDKAENLLAIALGSPGIEVVGFESHLATAEEPTGDYAELQIRRFRELEARLGLPRSIIRHLANSAATLLYPEAHWDMVRPGLLLYGIPPRPDAPLPFALRRALSVTARITQLREVEAGVSVGYGRSFITTRSTRLALLPVGYADGLPRSLSNRQTVLVGGRRCPLIGAVSMDQCTVDVTDVEVALGDEAVLLGSQGSDEIRVEEWASCAGTVPYEIICGLGRRLPKRYHR